MRISFVQPRCELRPYLESLWVFESPVGMPRTEQSKAAQNGCAKLIIPYENSLIANADGRVHISHEQGLYFVCKRDTSTIIESSSARTGFIAIEFCPFGAYPIFRIPMNETVNRLLDAEDAFGRWGRNVREALSNLQKVEQKVDFIQDQLVSLLRRNQRHNTVIEFCVNTLKGVVADCQFRSWRGRLATAGGVWTSFQTARRLCSKDSG